MDKSIKGHIECLKQNAVDFISEEEAYRKLKEKSKLSLKIGFDPTAKDIHLGHTVLLRKLRKLQDLGHEVCLIIGDFTAKIGDPSGRTALRPVLSDEEIKANAATYTKQAFKILDRGRTTVYRNSQWFKKMKLSDFLSLLSIYTLARILERDDFSQRFKENRPLTILEMTYPLIQGYDSIMVKADVEFGGTDQKFNLLVGRQLQESFGQKPQLVVTMPILVGLDGKNKMSKSLGNYIGITEEPKSIFGKVMSISDEVMIEYYRLLTDNEPGQIKSMHPKKAKSLLAEKIVEDYYGKLEARKQSKEFERVYSKKEIPENIQTHKTGSSVCDLVEILYKFKVVSSKNEARRLLKQGAIYELDPDDASQRTINDEKVRIPPEKGLILKLGKKIFRRFVS
ncbi:MAG: tyrosine--tRNA ligase [Candidatus Omnitrophica bacterium]|nr:tyrosine--tRNA ligase [Candidatus Omnitrophota bacterium]